METVKSSSKKTICLLFLLFVKSVSVFAQISTVNNQSAVDYILSCQKSNGAFGPVQMEYTDVAWTYPAVHALKILGVEISNSDSVYKNGSRSFMEIEGWKNGPWYWSLHQKANLYRLLGKTGPLEESFPQKIVLNVKFKERNSYLEPKDYDKGVFFDMASLWNVLEAVKIMNGNIENREVAHNYILKRQTTNGGFEEMLGKDTIPKNSKAHLLVTYNAVMCLNQLGFEIPNQQKLVDWILSCQSEDGGFRWSPENNSSSNKSDVLYTWAAVHVLSLLNKKPNDLMACVHYLNLLQNADGGFGDKPGWSSRLYSTFYAVETLHKLTGDVKTGITEKKVVMKEKRIPEGEYSIFQAQHKTPSGGNDMVDSIAKMKFNLVGVKTLENEVLEGKGMSDIVKNARKYAQTKKYPLEIVDSPENYRHKLFWFSGMKGDHCSNLMIPPEMNTTEKQKYLDLYNEGLKEHSWKVFQEKVITPSIELGTLFYPELDYNMMNAYIVYDEGLENKNGYNAVPAAHFNNIDWIRHFPYKERWIGHLPMIADGDAHGDFKKWKPNLEMFRNVFIAKNYKLNDYVDASLNGRSVCVIKMPNSNEVRYYGTEEAIIYLKKHLNEWKWWNN